MARVRPKGFHRAPSWKMDLQQWQERKAERDRGLSIRAFVAAESQDLAELVWQGCMVCPAFLVLKKGKTNKWRMIVDQRPLNELCRRRRIKFQGLKELWHVRRPGMWTLTWDLEVRYMNLRVFRPHWRYMVVDMGVAMAADGEPISRQNPKFVECQVMPFRSQDSLWFFVKIMKVVQVEVAELGITCLMWLDSGIVLADTKKCCSTSRSS